MERSLATLFSAWLILAAPPVVAAEVLSHPPLRPLPAFSNRPIAEGPALFADAARGDDAGDGSQAQPWRTINHALTRLRPGDTLHLRGGVYYERVVCSARGRADAPITIRSYPAEIAILDAGFQEFLDRPERSWAPFLSGAEGEYRSTAEYPQLGEGGLGRRNVGVVGNFADSMIPLHGYHALMDLRADPAVFDAPPKGREQGLYCGPGVWYDAESKRIHIRLAHTVYEGLDKANYAGETDPRRMPLVIGGAESALRVEGAAHLRFQDLVFRGTRTATVRVAGARDIVFEGVTVYGGSPTFSVERTEGLRLLHSALRGVSAPWSSRASEKYRGLSAYLFTSGRENHGFEMAWCEFTDCHDGLTIGSIHGLEFHHNLVDNFNDDGLYLTTGLPPGRDIRIHHNRISRCLSSLSFAGSGAGQEESVAHIYRNIFDLREPINRGHAQMGSRGAPARTCGDHGGPIWMPMMIYQNTFLLPETMWRGYYGGGLTRAMNNTRRQIVNNIFCHVKGMPQFGLLFSETAEGLLLDYNLHWSTEGGPEYEGDFLAASRKPLSRRPNWHEESKKTYPPGWTAHDLFADPRFASVSADWREPVALTLAEDSPARKAGMRLPADWPDPLRPSGEDKPDLGAVPFGVEPWRIGVRGRFTLFGERAEAE